MEGIMKLDNYHFIYNAQAHFNAKKRYPDGLLKAIQSDDFDAICWALEELSTQGELVRRDMGHDRETPLKAETVRRLLMPIQIIDAKNIIYTAIARGMSSGDETEEVDEVIAENQKKTASN
jgi:hypothetical protein